MDFEYCESCGRRVARTEIEAGHGGYVGAHYYCEDCAPPDAVPAQAARVTGKRRRSRTAGRDDSPQSRAVSRIGYDEFDYYDEPRSTRKTRRRAAPRRRTGNGRGASASRKKNNTALVAGGAAGFVVLVLLIALAAGAFKSKPRPTPTPLPTATQAFGSYRQQLAEAKRIRDEAIRLYEKGKNSSNPAKGIKKALEKLDEAINILFAIQDRYENAGRECPQDVDKLLTDLNSLKKGWRKSMPIDVWH